MKAGQIKPTFLFVETLRRKAGEATKEDGSPLPNISFSSSSDSQFTAVQLSSRRGSRLSSESGHTKDKLEDFDSLLASEASLGVLSDFSFVEEDRHSKISTLILTPTTAKASNHNLSTVKPSERNQELGLEERISTIYTNLSSDTSQVVVTRESYDRSPKNLEASKPMQTLRGATSATTWEGEDEPRKHSPKKKSLGIGRTFTFCSQCQSEVFTEVTIRLKPMSL